MGSDMKHQSIRIVGLPGAGKKKVQGALQSQFGLLPERVVVAELNMPLCTATGDQVWCVLDVRSPFDTEQHAQVMNYLTCLLHLADGVVLNFTEMSDLQAQTFWVQWLRQQFGQMPVVRLLNGRFPEGWQGFSAESSIRCSTSQESETALQAHPDIQRYEFQIGRVSLEHLMMGLDNSRRNLKMQIWRVQAVVECFEYINCVALEGTPFRWDTYAAEEGAKPGTLRIEGVGLQKKWLQELIEASELSF